MHGSRVGTAPDVQRIGAGVSFPGIDPRTWVSQAEVISFSVEGDAGVFARVLVHYDNTEHTARVGAAYAGDGFGIYAPLDPGDQVIVGYPNGQPNDGLVVIARVWSAAVKPPQAAVDHPADLIMVVKPDNNMRVAVSGGGNIVLTVKNGKVLLADEGATEAYLYGTSFRASQATLHATLAAQMNLIATDPFLVAMAPQAAAAAAACVVSLQLFEQQAGQKQNFLANDIFGK